MSCRGFIKRVVPFFLTFAAGLFVASFFVSVTAPTFTFRGDRGSYRFGEIQRLRIENRELRETNCRQRRQIEELRRQAMTADGDVFTAVPPVIVDAPPPPPPPRAPRFVK